MSEQLCEVCGLPALITAPTVGRAWCYWHRTDPQNEYVGSEQRQRDLLAAVFDGQRRRIDETVRQRDQLRFWLEPLLDRPFLPGSILCQFCAQNAGTFDDLGHLTGTHAPDCPALPATRDTLLGRERAPAPSEGPAT